MSRPEGDALARYGNNLLPIDYEPREPTSPVFAYPYARTRESLEHLRRSRPAACGHGYKMQFVNPATGGYADADHGAFVQLLPEGFAGSGYRSTDGSVFHVIEGAGAVIVGEQRIALRRPRHVRGAGVAAVPVRGARRRRAVQLLRPAGAARARSVARRAAVGVTPILLSPVLFNHADAAWFACLGLPLAPADLRDARAYSRRSNTRPEIAIAAGLRLEARPRRSPAIPTGTAAWWAREEAERERLMRVAQDRLGHGALLERLTAATETGV